MAATEGKTGGDAADAAGGATLRLVSHEGESFEVPVRVAQMSELVKTMTEDGACVAPRVARATSARGLRPGVTHSPPPRRATAPRAFLSGAAAVLGLWAAHDARVRAWRRRPRVLGGGPTREREDARAREGD